MAKRAGAPGGPTGTAKQVIPMVVSSSSLAHPRARTVSRSASRAGTDVSDFAVRAGRLPTPRSLSCSTAGSTALVFVLFAVLLPATFPTGTNMGRYLYVVGANPRAADLVGIRRRRVVISAFVGSGLVTAFAGVLLVAQQQIGDPSAGQSYLLPAFVGALLGSTTIKPGRANAFGTLVAVAVLAIGLSGLQQLGAEFWVTPLFNGLTLLAAVGLAGLAARRRQRAAAVIGASGRGASVPRPTTTTSV